MTDLNDKILTCVSPSNIGTYAACPKRLVYDATFGRTEKDFLKPYADFGTISHWMAQSELIRQGIAVAIPGEFKQPEDKTYVSAMECKGILNSNRAQFEKWVAMVAKKAVEALLTVSPLAPGTHWIVEKKSYHKGLMPDRRGRKGDLVGFGGSIDVLRSDRKILWDFKFTGADTTPPTHGNEDKDDGISNEYLWQMCSYHLTEGVDETGLLWTRRNAEEQAYLKIDWTQPRAKEFAESVRGFVSFVNYKQFPQLAWPVRGAHCKKCDHKSRCGIWTVGGASHPAEAGVANSLQDLLGSLECGVVDAAGVATPKPVSFFS